MRISRRWHRIDIISITDVSEILSYWRLLRNGSFKKRTIHHLVKANGLAKSDMNTNDHSEAIRDGGYLTKWWNLILVQWVDSSFIAPGRGESSSWPLNNERRATNSYQYLFLTLFGDTPIVSYINYRTSVRSPEGPISSAGPSIFFTMIL
jgi:hypothetical protein